MMRVYPGVDPWTLEPPNFDGLYLGSATRYFDLVFETEWFQNTEIQEMIRDVDKTEWVAGRYFESPILGPISPRELSGGVKGLILVSHSEDLETQPVAFSSCIWGDNCVKWLCKLSFTHNFYLVFKHPLGTDPIVNGKWPVCAQKFDATDWNTPCFNNWDDIWIYRLYNENIFGVVTLEDVKKKLSMEGFSID